MLPTTMTAIGIRAPGGPDVLQVQAREVPAPTANQVLIRVRAAGVNRHDCGQRQRGTPPPGATDIPGLEVAGEVVAAGASVRGLTPGAPVCALVNGGGYAQYCVADAPLVLPVPAGFDMQRAACLPEALFTLWFNVFDLGGLRAGETLLIHGGASGVGTMTIQVARARGARVLVTAGTDEKCASCLRLGAEHAVNYNTQEFVAETARITNGRGVDVIFDMAGGLYAERNLHAIAADGRIVHLTTRGEPDFRAPLELILRKRARITGSFLRPLPLDRKMKVAESLRRDVWPLLGAQVNPVIDSVFPLADAAAAHRRMESNLHIGKILLTPAHE